MSYYTIKPSNRVGNANQSMFGQGQNPDPMKPLMTTGGFRTRELNPNELSSNQLNQITDENGAYIQRARAAGLNQANSRGLTNSSMAAGAAQGAAIDAAMPMAMQQAGAYTNIGDRNMDAENTYLLKQGDWDSADRINQNNNATSMSIAGMTEKERQRQFDLGQAEDARRYNQNFADSQSRYNTDWDREQQATETANRNARNNYIGSGIMNTIFSDPSLWRDGPGAMGMANYFATNFGSLWDTTFSNPGSTPASP